MKSRGNAVNLIVRKSTPAEASEMCQLIHSSGPKAWDYVFSEARIHSIDFLEESFCHRGNTISYSNHFAAISDGKIVGSILTYKQPEFLLLTIGTFIRICLQYGLSFLKVVKRGLKVETMIQPPKFGRLYLAHIAVNAQYRNLGIAKSLIHYAVNHLDSDKIISLDVSTENEPAIKLYQSLGFEIIETRILKNNPNGIPNHHYMEAKREVLKLD